MTARIREVQSSIEKVLSCLYLFHDPQNKACFPDSLQVLIREATALRGFFDPNGFPDPVRKLERAAENLRQNPNNFTFIKALCDLHDDVDGVVAPSHDLVSFQEIYDSYKNDGELDKLVSELIENLRKILAEGDDVLSAQVSRDLHKLLEELEKRKGKSLFEIGPWIEWSIVSLGAVADMHFGTPLASILISCAVTASKSRERLRALAATAWDEFLEKAGLPRLRKLLGSEAILLRMSPEQLETYLKEPRRESLASTFSQSSEEHLSGSDLALPGQYQPSARE